MDGIDVVAFVFLLIRIFVLIPTMLYGLFLFYHYKNHKLIKSRNPMLIYIVIPLTVVTLFFERTFMVSIIVWHIIHVDIWIVYFGYSIFWWALFALLAVKAYNLYYQQKYNRSIADNVWKQCINPQNEDWYIKNKNTWGSTSWLTKLCIIPYVISCTTEALVPYFFGDGLGFSLFHFTVISIPVCVSFAVLYKARALDDIYKIRNEIFYQALVIFCALSLYTIVFCVAYIPFLRNKYNVDLIRLEWATYSFLTDLCAMSFAIVPTLYPIYLIKKGELSEFSSFNSVSLSSTDISVGLDSMDFIMTQYRLFKSFMDHLVSEFAVENALFLVELILIKHDFQKRNNFRVKTKVGDEIKIIDFNLNPINGKTYQDEKQRYFTYLFHECGSIRSKISMPIEIPKSWILTQNEDDLSKQMMCLYNKYIDRLNIPYNIREVLDNVFLSEGKLDEEAMLFNIMDECAVEILSLLHQSYYRFMSTESFAPILKEIKMQNKNIKIRSDLEMIELLNSKSVPIITTLKHTTNISS